MSSQAEHDAEQAAISALCQSGKCDHPHCKETFKRKDYACPDCDAGIYVEATLYWDVDAQGWEIGGDSEPDDRTTCYCGDCGGEFDLSECKKEEEDETL